MRVISVLQNQTQEHAPACALATQTPEVTRRSLLKGGGVLMGTLAAGSPLALLAPSTTWALALQTLTQAEGDTLLQMGRALFPHPQLPDAVYALLVKDLDGSAAASADAARDLRAGIASLDHLAGGSFLKASAGRRLEAVKAMEGQAFFNTVRGKCVTALYDNEMAFAVFGYEGAAWEKGGYLTRGFQDLTWLPDPSAEASPPSS
ncbi:tat (twin-arginine translocation) pathway signal sequence [Ottowia sp.]|uniref:tat (twin-arginine translocation) pathway signal sequence n=1 Tax=Ottowia sp. TaxID=1898956 RepID=UPI003A8A9D2D